MNDLSTIGYLGIPVLDITGGTSDPSEQEIRYSPYRERIHENAGEGDTV